MYFVLVTVVAIIVPLFSYFVLHIGVDRHDFRRRPGSVPKLALYYSLSNISVVVKITAAMIVKKLDIVNIQYAVVQFGFVPYVNNILDYVVI